MTERKQYEDRLRIRYFEDAEFRRHADAIHNSRMMSGAACMQCMEIADKRYPPHENPETNL